jgi:DNA-binding response OmpR family regulator
MPTVLLINFSSSEGEDVKQFLSMRGYTCLLSSSLLDDPSLLAFFEKEAHPQSKVDVAIIHLTGEPAHIEKVHLFLTRIQELDSTTCIIVSGDPVFLEDISLLLRSGVYDYLRAPILLEKLDNTINQGLQMRENAKDVVRSMALANERLLEEKDRLQMWNHDLSHIYQINQTLASFLNPGLTISAFAEGLKPLIPYDTLSILLKSHGRPDRVWVFPHRSETTNRDYIKEEAALLGKALPLCDEKSETRVFSEGSEVLIPLMTAAEKLGILRITRRSEGAYPLPLNEYQRRVLLMVTTSLSLSLRNAEMYQQVRELAATDELTHILNRRAFLNILERELKRANRLQTTLALLLID